MVTTRPTWTDEEAILFEAIADGAPIIVVFYHEDGEEDEGPWCPTCQGVDTCPCPWCAKCTTECICRTD